MSEKNNEIELDDEALERAAGGVHTDFSITKPVNTTLT